MSNHEDLRDHPWTTGKEMTLQRLEEAEVMAQEALRRVQVAMETLVRSDISTPRREALMRLDLLLGVTASRAAAEWLERVQGDISAAQRRQLDGDG